MTDAIDRAAGLSPEDARYAQRRLRPEFVQGAEVCRASVLTPATDHALDPALRVALARRMALMNGDGTLADQYAVGDDHADVASGSIDLAEPLATIVRHVDMVTRAPSMATANDIAKLEAAGLTHPQIVALSELIAFVNFQSRVIAGLRLMGAA